MIKCSCGHLGTITFVRNMRKLQRTFATTEKHWETVEKIDDKYPVRNALIVREVEMCEYCQEVDYLKFEDFSEVTK